MKSAIGIMADSKQQGPPFSPEQLTGLMGWWDATDAATITQVANAVSQWNDKSPNLFHVTQATGANQPVTNTTNINGKNTLSFNGTTHFLTRVPCQIVHATTGDWTSFGVVKLGVATAARHILDQDSGVSPTRIATFLRTNTTNLAPIGFNTVPTAFADNAATISAGLSLYFSAVKTATAIEVWRLGVSNGPTAITGTPVTGTYNLGVGANRTGGTPQFFFQGEIGEMIVYNVALSTTDRVAVQNYLKAKWGL